MVERPKLTVVECVVGDDTGSIVLSAKNEQGVYRSLAGCSLRNHARLPRSSLRPCSPLLQQPCPQAVGPTSIPTQPPTPRSASTSHQPPDWHPKTPN